ncbi:MAG: hypothetical protein V2A73_18425, partial [Pseudomonadota bacterium]
DSTIWGLNRRAARAFQRGIQTSTFGVGDSFDATRLATIADQGAGGYYYLASPAEIAGAFGRELAGRLMPVAQAVEIRVRLRPDVVPLKVFGSHALDAREAAAVRQQEIAMDSLAKRNDGIAANRQDDTEGGMRFFLPSFARDDRHALLLQLQVPTGQGSRPIASVEVRYKDRLRTRNATAELPVRADYADSDAASAASANLDIARTVQAYSAGEAILAAARLLVDGQRPAAVSVLRERANLLEKARDRLHDALLGKDAMRLFRLADIAGGKAEEDAGDPLAVALLLRGAGYGYLQ